MDEFSRYQRMLSQAAIPALAAAQQATVNQGGQSSPRTNAQPLSVNLGVPAARLLLEPSSDQYPALAEGFKRLIAISDAHLAVNKPTMPQLADGLGHKRAVYWPFVVHLHIAAFTRQYESLPAGLWSACESALPQLVEPMREVERFTDQAPPAWETHLVLWQALCLCEQAIVASRDIDLEWIDALVHQVVARPGPDGSLHPQPPPEPPEAPEAPEGASKGNASHGNKKPEHGLDAWTYRELTGLHALANLALVRRNQAWAKRVQEIGLYHLHHTQPDHVTAQPWGVFAFVWSPQTRIFADQQIHDATAYGVHWSPPSAANPAGQIGPLAAMLLADAAACLSLLI